MPHSPTTLSTLARAGGLGALAGLVALAGPAEAMGALTCHAWPTQTCHYALTGGDGSAVQRFTLHNGEQRTLQDARAGQHYMLSINFDPPAREDACSRSPHPEAKRSSWCQLGDLPDRDQP